MSAFVLALILSSSVLASNVEAKTYSDECAMKLSPEMLKFKEDLVDLMTGESVDCQAYPIKFFPCLFCECTQYEFIKDNPVDPDDHSYRCEHVGKIKTDYLAVDPKVFDKMPKSGVVQRMNGGGDAVKLGSLVRDFATGRYFVVGNRRGNGNSYKAQDTISEGGFADFLTELDGGENAAEVKAEFEADIDVTADGEFYYFDNDIDAVVGGRAIAETDGQTIRQAITGGGLARANTYFAWRIPTD